MSEIELRETLEKINSEIRVTQREIDSIKEMNKKTEQQRISEEKLKNQVKEAQIVLKSLKQDRDNIKKVNAE